MTTIEPTMTLASIVNAHPGLARELERRHLDYCCGGANTLAAACTDAGLDPTSVVAALEAAAGEAAEAPAPWRTMGPVELVDHLEVTHHRYLWEEMPRVSALLEKIVSVHGERHPELQSIATCFAELRAELEPHLMKEERVLFPMIRELAAATEPPSFHCGTLANPVSVMLREHDAAGALLAQLRVLAGDYAVPSDGCATYRSCFAGLEELERDTHLHVHKENNLLFPMVLELERRLERVGS